MGQLVRRGAAGGGELAKVKKDLPAVAKKELPAKPLSETEEKFLSQLFLSGEISKLDDTQKWDYLKGFCLRLNVDPYTQPFGLITFKGKMTLYAKRGCADQLSRKHLLSTQYTNKYLDDDGCFVVESLIKSPNGRTTEEIGVVYVGTAAGEELANMKMKAHTKARRRGILAHLGLGILDEAEAESLVKLGAQAVDIIIPEDDQPKKEAPEAKRLPRRGEKKEESEEEAEEVEEEDEEAEEAEEETEEAEEETEEEETEEEEEEEEEEESEEDSEESGDDDGEDEEEEDEEETEEAEEVEEEEPKRKGRTGWGEDDE